jgi:hypothetical protein
VQLCRLCEQLERHLACKKNGQRIRISPGFAESRRTTVNTSQNVAQDHEDVRISQSCPAFHRLDRVHNLEDVLLG